ncbi:mannitol dehydrogenase domain protein [Acetobacteraceae bacterium AT-5844]|nr:mannitol dehydrogenase domain protein [Acetobacteraceae bacterium AT-5844]
MNPPRLSTASLPCLPSVVRRPAYDRAALGIGIAHLGLGAFHRAHQAVFTDERIAAGETDWGISGMSLRSPAVRNALAPQDGLYTVLERGPAGDSARIIGSVAEVLTVPEQPDRAMARLTDASTRIISLTVTEKAYCRAADGGLDHAHPDINRDLTGDAFPRSVPGLLVEALRRRRAAKAPPCTVLCCDNLPRNGETVGRLTEAFAMRRDPQLAAWIRTEVAFPSTMVDRIVPSTQDEDRAAVAALGYADAWPVVAEPFTQWVIEDRFSGPRPRWEAAGALLVDDVHVYELMKLRCLNGAHSTLAYLGALAGTETVSEAMAEPALAGFLSRLWREDLLPTLPATPGVDLSAYTAQLADRFRNPRIRHRLLQIAMDGSQKLPQRLLGPALERLRAGAMPRAIAIAVAGWMAFLLGADERGGQHEIDDPMSERLVMAARTAGRDATALSNALLAIRDIFPGELAEHEGFRREVRSALDALLTRGVRASLHS